MRTQVPLPDGGALYFEADEINGRTWAELNAGAFRMGTKTIHNKEGRVLAVKNSTGWVRFI